MIGPFDFKAHLADPAVAMCSLEAQGLWMRLLCIMAQGDEPGRLSFNGKPHDATGIARMVGCGISKRRLNRLMDELRRRNVFSVDENGVPYSRRMVREHAAKRGAWDVSPGEWMALRAAVFERDGYTCTYCGSMERLSCDHVIPRSRGGRSIMENLTTACTPCNSSKGALLPSEWRAEA